ncbi:hypothetical protein ACWCQL_37700 [Streptomyces sp. NPDC002073]
MVPGRNVRLAAVLVAVVLALTGFSSGGSKGGGSKSGSGKSRSSSSGGHDSSGSGGGGCSSSKKKNGTHSDSDWDDDNGAQTVAGTGGSAGTATATATAAASDLVTVEIVDCAGPADRRSKATGKKRKRTSSGSPETNSTLKVTSTSSVRHTFTIEVDFMGTDAKAEIDDNTGRITLDPYETREIRVPMTAVKRAKDVKRCEIDGITLVS